MAGIQDLVSGLVGGVKGVDLSKLTDLAGPLLETIQSKGGLGSVVEQLQQSSIGSQVSSWIGAGPNLPVNPDQITQAMPQVVSDLAAKTGQSAGDVATELSQLLPNLIDKVTPGGSIPGADQVQGVIGSLPGADQVTGLLGGLFGQK